MRIRARTGCWISITRKDLEYIASLNNQTLRRRPGWLRIDQGWTGTINCWAQRKLFGRRIGINSVVKVGRRIEISSIKYNEIIETARKGCMLAVVSTDKLEPWSAKKSSENDASVYNSGWRNSRFKIFKSYMFITMCQLTSSSHVQPKWNEQNLLEVESTPIGLKIHYKNGRTWTLSNSDQSLKIRTYGN